MRCLLAMCLKRNSSCTSLVQLHIIFRGSQCELNCELISKLDSDLNSELDSDLNSDLKFAQLDPDLDSQLNFEMEGLQMTSQTTLMGLERQRGILTLVGSWLLDSELNRPQMTLDLLVDLAQVWSLLIQNSARKIHQMDQMC